MPPRAHLPGLLAASFCSVLVAGSSARAQDKPALSGQWSASPMHIGWNIGDWGEACGPKPGAAAPGAGSVEIRQRSNELTITGQGRSYSTTQCWEQFPGLNPISHSGSARGWRTVCKTPPNDSRQATVITTLSATDDTISFDETGQYQFVVKGQNCTASARRTRSFRLVRRDSTTGPAPQPTTTASAPSTKLENPYAATPRAKADRASRCERPGAPARLEVRPARKLMRPGEDFTFRAVVLDAAGCRVFLAPSWSKVDPAAPGRLDGPGRVHIPADAPEGELRLAATVAKRTAEVVVEIASKQRYEALLQSGSFDPRGESAAAAVAVIAGGSIGARATSVDHGESRRRIWLVSVVGGATLLLGALGLILIGRRRRSRPVRALAEAGDAAAPPAAAAPRAKVCPICGTEYPGGSQFCGRDGAQLMPVN